MGKRGLSLLEIICSLFVLGLGLVLLANLFPTSALAVRRSENLLQAHQLADAILAEYAARPFQELEIGPPVTLDVVEREGVRLKPRVEVFSPEDSEPEHLLGIRVTVSWSEGGSPRRVVQELWLADVPR
ncbi:MAG: hypothetical protein HY319_19695 [Armatimonadetes bacterium]|nr:hypothetical protein [Armatimonadota bacterium]